MLTLQSTFKRNYIRAYRLLRRVQIPCDAMLMCTWVREVMALSRTLLFGAYYTAIKCIDFPELDFLPTATFTFAFCRFYKIQRSTVNRLQHFSSDHASGTLEREAQNILHLRTSLTFLFSVNKHHSWGGPSCWRGLLEWIAWNICDDTNVFTTSLDTKTKSGHNLSSHIRASADNRNKWTVQSSSLFFLLFTPQNYSRNKILAQQYFLFFTSTNAYSKLRVKNHCGNEQVINVEDQGFGTSSTNGNKTTTLLHSHCSALCSDKCLSRFRGNTSTNTHQAHRAERVSFSWRDVVFSTFRWVQHKTCFRLRRMQPGYLYGIKTCNVYLFQFTSPTPRSPAINHARMKLYLLK